MLSKAVIYSSFFIVPKNATPDDANHIRNIKLQTKKETLLPYIRGCVLNKEQILYTAPKHIFLIYQGLKINKKVTFWYC